VHPKGEEPYVKGEPCLDCAVVQEASSVRPRVVPEAALRRSDPTLFNAMDVYRDSHDNVHSS
jgi:hypothetical protein